MLASSGGAVTPQWRSIPQGYGLPGRTCPGEGGGKGCRTLRGAWTRSLVWDGAPSWALELTLLRPPAKGI